MNTVMKKWAYMLIIAGILVMIYPQANEWYDDWQQERLLNQAEQAAAISHQNTTKKLKNSYSEVNALLNEGSSADNINSKTEALVNGEILGVIRIPVINVELPIIEGATRENMRSAAVHISETDQLGQKGNFAVAAHRAHKTGRLFNRLGEVKVGDSIQIESSGQQYNYQVDRIRIVEPTEVSVLDSDHQSEELTLVTCDPLINPTHRLIVHAIRVYNHTN
ncbi:class D sortase [Paenibacillus bovis]|nr:class D sortase [Paenibacillus bovis]